MESKQYDNRISKLHGSVSCICSYSKDKRQSHKYITTCKAGGFIRSIKDLTRPNGLAFSADGKTLFIAQSDPEKAYIMSYPVQTDGSVGKGKLFFDATPMSKTGLKGSPDGLKLDIEGNIWTSGPGGILILSPDGKLLGKIETDGELASNCAWGDDGSTLYITVDGYLCRIRTNTTGANW